MAMNNVEEVMNKFAKQVVDNAKLNLMPGNLKESVRYDFEQYRNSFYLEFFMADYGFYQDQGVSGTMVKYGTKFSYTSDATAYAKKKGSHASAIAKWAKKKFIRFRNADGTFKKGNYNSIGFVIARSIKRKGIKPSLFFTKPFEYAFRELPDDVLEAYGLELDKSIKSFVNNERVTVT